jgi:hypothetical protein
MKYVFFIFIIWSFYSCTHTNAQEKNPIIHAEHTTYNEYSGKTVKSIIYYNESKKTMCITFTDGTALNIIANKYVLDVQKKY